MNEPYGTDHPDEAARPFVPGFYVTLNYAPYAPGGLQWRTTQYIACPLKKSYGYAPSVYRFGPFLAESSAKEALAEFSQKWPAVSRIPCGPLGYVLTGLGLPGV